ncbi:MAG: aminopeptidase P family protein [Acidobacteriota bacterium]
MKSLRLRLMIGLLIMGAAGIAAQDSSDWRLWGIPPALKPISSADRLAELASRRREVAQRIGTQGILMLFSAEPRVYASDQDYPYRQENNLYYLTGIKQAGVTLLLIPGASTTKEILFVPRRDPWQETWTGRMLSVEQATAQSGIREVWDISLLDSFIATIAPRATLALASRGPMTPAPPEMAKRWQDDLKSIVDLINADRGELFLLVPAERDSREYRQEQAFAGRLAQITTGLSVRNAAPIFAELRLRKSPWELTLLQHAVDITSEAFHRMLAMAAPGLYEYEVQAEFEYTFRRRNADNWGYPCIVGSGDNATTLHYITNQERIAEGSLLLMDCAAEYDHYTADITRTLPVNGRFTKEQAEIYRIVYDAQMESIKNVRPGNFVGTRRDANISPTSVHGRAVEVVKDGLLRLGLITSKANEEYRVWFMHGTSHWLGMNVHDVGDYSTPLAANMVLTVEPGIYIRPDALDVLPKTPEMERFARAVRPAFERYKGIGVRIEDDVLVTSGEPRVMSAAIPSKLEDVEATMARLKQELRRKGFPSVASQ